MTTDSYSTWAQEQTSEDDGGSSSSDVSAISRLLRGNSSPQDVAIELTGGWDPLMGGVEERMIPDWEFIIDAAQEVPEKQDLLVQLLQAIRHLPEPHSEGKKTDVMEKTRPPLADLPGFGMGMRERWNYFDPSPDEPDRMEQRQSWCNLNAFAARLTAQHCCEFTNFGLWSLRTALEDVPADICGLDGDVPAAAQWMLHAGQTIFECDDEMIPHPQLGDWYKGGQLWDGKHGFCPERWAVWKRRFVQIRDIPDLDEETKRWASEAEKAMNVVDGDDARAS